MTLATLVIAFDALSAVLLLIAIVFTVGIVWRAEKELDISYKLFLVALIFLVASESVGKIFSETAFFSAIASFLHLFFTIFLLGGIWTMRDILRKLDGEKKERRADSGE